MIEVSWSDIKSFTDTRGLSIQWIDANGNYYLCAFDGLFNLRCILNKSLQLDDVSEFEASYKANGNTRLDPKDTDGSTIFRAKSTRAGWHYQPRWLTFTTSLFGGPALHNKHADTVTDYGDAELRFWKIVNGAWVELLRSNYLTDLAYQLALTTECTITTMDWWAQFDFDIRGGVFLNGPRPIYPSYGYIVVAPDIPAFLGGSVPFLDGGVPLHLMPEYGYISQDAGTVKGFAFDSVYKSNKIRLIIDHPVGTQVDLAMAFQIYRL